MQTYRVDNFVLSGVIVNAAKQATETHGLKVGSREIYHVRGISRLRIFRTLLALSDDRDLVDFADGMVLAGSSLVLHQGDQTAIHVDVGTQTFDGPMDCYKNAAAEEEAGDHLLTELRRSLMVRRG